MYTYSVTSLRGGLVKNVAASSLFLSGDVSLCCIVEFMPAMYVCVLLEESSEK